MRRFTLAPGSDFGVDALAALDAAGARTVPWDRAVAESHDLIIAASPKGELDRLKGPVVLLPHGAGFNKTVGGEGAEDSASGLDPNYLLRDNRPLATLHALAHPDQITRLADRCPAAAARAAVLGDPTLDRILESRTLRDRYRAALGTGDRRLIVLVSTWGPESLLARRPGLAERLCGELPLDEYQLALIAHPNIHSEPGTFELAEWLPREVVLAGPHEEWAALLIAADAVVSDHGSSALYAAALNRPVVGAYDGGTELIPGTPMDRLLSSAPRLAPAGRLDEALAAHRPDVPLAAARAAFDVGAQGHALDRLRTEVYRLLRLPRQPGTPLPRLLPAPRHPVDTPAAFGVRVERRDGCLEVERRPARVDVPPPHHLAAEEDAAGARAVMSAGLLYRRWHENSRGTPEDWTADVLARHPGCRTAGVILSPERCLLRRRDATGMLLSVRIEPLEPLQESERAGALRLDPAAVLSAVHALSRDEVDASLGSSVNCRVARSTCRVWLTAT
nr:translation initiation factor 2 [Streptomyces scabichelini]